MKIILQPLNNDGWIDTDTGNVAREYEWKEGKEWILDYNGEVIVNTSSDSIKWGIRWLYHKAQGITVDGKRYWRSWNEAVRNYNGQGNTQYEREVYNVYENEIDERDKSHRIKLWVSLFLIFNILASGIIFGIKFYRDQGKIWLTFEQSKDERVDYILTANIVDGFKIKRKEVSKLYDDGRNSLAITKESNPDFYFQNLLGGLKDEIIITGNSIGGNIIYYILKETRGGLEIIPIIKEYGSKEIAFDGHSIKFIDLDRDQIMEVKEAFYISYSNAPDQVWYSWYKYNETKGIYEFFRKDKEEAKEFWWL